MKIAKMLYRIERKHPKECSGTRQEALALSMDWLEHVWGSEKDEGTEEKRSIPGWFKT